MELTDWEDIIRILISEKNKMQHPASMIVDISCVCFLSRIALQCKGSDQDHS